MSNYIKESSIKSRLIAMERLVQVVQELSQAKTLEEVTSIVRIAARELTNADGATMVLREGEHCYYVEENSISPLWKGMRFPIDLCVSGWVMQNSKSAIIKDIYKDPRVPHEAYKPTFVKSMVMVPIRKNAPIGAIGNYWAKERMPSDEDVAILQALADTTSVALENAQLYTDLKSQIAIVQERESRIKAQKETLEVFTSALAHDLKEPVRTVNSFSDLVSQEIELSGKAKRYFAHINRASKRMLILIESVLNYMQLEKGADVSKESCNMNVLFADVKDGLSAIIQERNIHIIAYTLPTITANKVLMRYLLNSLITNALIHNNDVSEIKVSAEKENDFWLFKVTDNGQGINEEDILKIFLPFKRASSESQNIGMGLATAARIVEAHNGKIWCESSHNEGSTFLFTINIQQGNSVSKINELSDVVTQDNELANLLIVDDMESDLELTEEIMRRSKIHCKLLTAKSGKEALDIMKSSNIDLVLLDINMPQMDGFETLEKIKANSSFWNVPVVMCSGSTYDKDRIKAESLGALGYIVKPVKKDSLEAVIANIANLQTHENSEGYCIQRKSS